MDEKRWSLASINLHTILRDVWKNLWMIVLVALSAVMLTRVASETIYKPEYTSSVTMSVTSKSGSNAVSDLNTTRQMASAFQGVLESDLLHETVAAAMGESSLPAQLKSSIIEGTNLLTISATADNARTAFLTVKAVMENYNTVSDQVLSGAVFTVVREPQIARAPSNAMSLRRRLMLAGALGALAMLAIIVLMSYLRDTVKREDEVKEKLDTHLIAVVPHEKRPDGKNKKEKHSFLITNTVISFAFEESIRQIRTRLEYAAKQDGAKIFLISSFGENEGKSTISANSALSLAEKGYRVLLIDADFRKPAQYKVLNRDVDEARCLGEYLRGTCGADKIIQTNAEANLYEMFGKNYYSDSAELLGSTRMKKLLEVSRQKMDFIIIDSPPMSALSDTEVLAEIVDATVLVVREDTSAVPDLNESIMILNESKSRLLGCVYNDRHASPLSRLPVYGKYADYYGYHGYYGYYGKYGKSSRKREG